MKIQLTENFLWDLYKIAETAGDAIDLLIKPIPSMRTTVFPNLYGNIIKQYKKRISEKNFSQFIYYLKKRGYIKSAGPINKGVIIITKAGIEKVLKLKWRIGLKQKRKDGKMIMVAFDIPEKKKQIRAMLRDLLKNLGYKMFQKSVWLSPFDVLPQTEEFVKIYKIERYVDIFLIEKQPNNI